MPNVLIDGSLYTFAPTGGGYYFLNELLARLPSKTDLNFRLITKANEPLASRNSGGIPVVNPPLSLLRHVPNGFLKNSLRPIKQVLDSFFLTATESKGRSLFHSIAYAPSPSPKVPMLSMVHDLIVEKFPNYYGEGVADNTRRSKELVIGRSIRYITVSHVTKNDLMVVYGIPAQDIDVIYHGVNKAIFNPTKSQLIFPELATLSSKPFFLHVGGRLNHKNFIRLAEAFALSGLAKSYQLVATGFPWEDSEHETIKKLGLAQDIHLIPNPSSQALAELYRRSTAFVFPSLYEGFGMPLVEAMACGTPVLASSTGPFPEIAGNAACYFDPFDPAAIAKSLVAATDESVRAALTAEGLARAENFNWETTTLQTVESYRKTFEKM